MFEKEFKSKKYLKKIDEEFNLPIIEQIIELKEEEDDDYFSQIKTSWNTKCKEHELRSSYP